MRTLFLLSMLLTSITTFGGQLPLDRPQADAKAKLAIPYAQLPLHFENNQGQASDAIKFLSRGQSYNLLLTATDAVLTLHKPDAQANGKTPLPQADEACRRDAFCKPGTARQQTPANAPAAVRYAASSLELRMHLAGAKANPAPVVEGLEQLPGKTNYFIGKDRAKWRTGISNYAKVRYRSVYPGIDLVYYGKQRQLEYDFIVQPGADPNDIHLDFSGIENVHIDTAGDLLLVTPNGELRLQKPVVYQTVQGRRKSIDGRFVLAGTPQSGKDAQVGFEIAAYDASQPLVVDPVLTYASYLGGEREDSAQGVAVDGDGNTIIVGNTYSGLFPMVNALDTVKNETFISKISPDGSTLLYSTYLGGSTSLNGWVPEETSFGVAVDSAGNATIVGSTTSTDFPTVNALFPNLHINPNYLWPDVFVAKLSTDGSQLLYSTYLGGIWDDARDDGVSIVLDNAGNAIVSGSTDSPDFPTTANALYPTAPVHTSIGLVDANIFVTKISADGSQLMYSTYLGGGDNDFSWDTAVDSSGNIIVTGDTYSTNFPVANAMYPTYTGSFISKISANGSKLLFSTFFPAGCNAVSTDNLGNIFLTGGATSDLPTINALYPTVHPTDPALNPYNQPHIDAYVAKLSANGSQLLFSTFLGGESREEYGADIAVDGAGNVILTGNTRSKNFPTVNAKYPNHSLGKWDLDAFVAKVRADGSQLVYSTYLGGTGDDQANALALDSAGNAVVVGQTNSADFPANTPFSNLSRLLGYDGKYVKETYIDAFIASKLDIEPCVAPCLAVQSPNGGEVWNKGDKKTIRWSWHDIAATETIVLFFSPDEGTTWMPVGSTKNTGSKSWNISKKGLATTHGLLKVCLKSNPAVCDSSDKPFTVNQAPVAEAGAKQTVIAGTNVQLNGGASLDPDAGPAALTYRWVYLKRSGFTDCTLSDETSATPSFVTSSPGTCVYGLVVYDGAAYSKPDKVSVTVLNKAPVAKAGPDQTVSAGATVHLDGSASYDPDNAPLPISYKWYLLEGNKPVESSILDNDMSATPNFTASSPGKYFFGLWVFDGGSLSKMDKVTIVVE